MTLMKIYSLLLEASAMVMVLKLFRKHHTNISQIELLLQTIKSLYKAVEILESGFLIIEIKDH